MNGQKMTLQFQVDGNDFTEVGEASSHVKKTLKQLGVAPEVIRKVSIAMYEGEVNMVIHADGGVITVDISPMEVRFILEDKGPGIADIDQAMQEGFSTATEDIRNMGFGAGMGLPNMKKYADEFQIQSTVGVGTRIEMAVKI